MAAVTEELWIAGGLVGCLRGAVDMIVKYKKKKNKLFFWGFGFF